MSHSTYYPPSLDLTFTMLTTEQETKLFTEARAGNTASRDFLIQNHLLFAAMHARRLSRGRLPDTDVVSAANVALMKAFERFDHTHGSRFTSYLRPFIQGEVSGLWKEHFKSTETIGEEYSEPGLDQPHVEVENAEHTEHLRKLLETCKGSLNEHEREIIQLHYFESKSFADIGRARKVSREAIRASHARAVEKLQKAFKALGVTDAQ